MSPTYTSAYHLQSVQGAAEPLKKRKRIFLSRDFRRLERERGGTTERAARAPGGLQAFLIAGGNKTEAPAAVHARAATLLERSTIVGTTERLPAFFGELCALLDIGCAGAPGRPAECAAPPTVAYQAYPRLRRSFLDKQPPGWPHGDVARCSTYATRYAAAVAARPRRRPVSGISLTGACTAQLALQKAWILVQFGIRL